MQGKSAKILDQEIIIPAREIVEKIIGSIINFNSIKVSHEIFTGKCDPVTCKSDLVGTINLSLT